jgi:hypothetical protein
VSDQVLVLDKQSAAPSPSSKEFDGGNAHEADVLLVTRDQLPPQAVISTLVARMADTDPDQQEAHKTSARLEDSIGRWKRDLPPPLVECCQQAFGDLLAEFGYPP